MQTHKRYWLRGGGISLLTVAILFIALYFSGIKATGLFGESIAFYLLLWPAWIIHDLLQIDLPNIIEIPLLISEPVVTYFVIGSTLVWIYGKIKNRNKV